jgi:outer membrane immunogenic protein
MMMPDTMLFLSVSYANYEADSTNMIAMTRLDWIPLAGNNGTLIADKNLSGGFIGGGIETRLTDTLSLKAEYRYIDLGKESVTLLPYDLPEINQLVSTTFDPDIQMGRLSINYRFGGPSSTEAVPLK